MHMKSHKRAVHCFAILFFCFSSSSFMDTAWAEGGLLKWSLATGDSIYASPAIAPDGTIYVGSYDKFFYAINPDGTKKWEYFTDLSIKSSAAIDDEGTLYFGANTDDMLFAITEDGEFKWSTKLHGWNILHVHATPAIGPDDTIYVGNTGIGLFWVDPLTGEKTCVHKTDYHRVYASAAVTPENVIYIGDDSGRLHSLGPGCKVNWTMKIGETKDRFYSSPAIGSDGTLYLATMTRNSRLRREHAACVGARQPNDSMDLSHFERHVFVTGGRRRRNDLYRFQRQPCIRGQSRRHAKVGV